MVQAANKNKRHASNARTYLELSIIGIYKVSLVPPAYRLFSSTGDFFTLS